MDVSPERLRDFVGAFVLAGRDAEAELKFFADRVDYFGERNASREKVRRDLVGHHKRWPNRHVWLAGDLEINAQPGGEVSVTFPLRYELRNGAKHAEGQVMKTIVLKKGDQNDLKIVGVNERLEGEKKEGRKLP